MQRVKVHAFQMTNGDLVMGTEPQLTHLYKREVIGVKLVNIHQHNETGERFAIRLEDTPLQYIVTDHLMITATLGTFDVYDTVHEAQEAFDNGAEEQAAELLRRASTGLSDAEAPNAPSEVRPSAVPHIVGEDPGPLAAG